MLSLIVGVVILFLVVALVIAMIEGAGGYVGDSSMIPGCLLIGILVLLVIMVIGLFTGNVGVWIH